jgi:hypothetical protein
VRHTRLDVLVHGARADERHREVQEGRLRSLAALALALAGCYSPDALDCTVACAAANDCADGQVCGSDGFCAAPSVAGHCGGPDGGMPSQLASLRVTIQGAGKIRIDSVGVCDSETAHDDACEFSVPAGMSISLQADANGEHEFRGWSGACAGTSSSSCTLTPVMGLTQVGAKFE